MNLAFKFEKFLEVFIDYGGYKSVLTGLKNTLIIAILGLAIGIILGTLIASVKVMPKYKRSVRILNKIADFYVGIFRGTPVVVQLLVGYYVVLPLLGINIDSIRVCIMIFGLNSAAYVSEIMRSGIMSVDPGQMEAGRSLGLGFGTVMMKVVVPQAVKNILPTLGNELIALVKETSVVSFVGAFSYIGANTYEFMVPYLVMAVIYIVIVFIISQLIKLMERRLRRSDRSN